jgi:hypothetical protein
MTIPLPGVPEQYQGGWQRGLYAEPNTPPYRVTDTTTQVVWLQGHQWHADLRIPTDAPDFSGIQTLEACSRPQLEWLASLTAFAGLTTRLKSSTRLGITSSTGNGSLPHMRKRRLASMSLVTCAG